MKIKSFFLLLKDVLKSFGDFIDLDPDWIRIRIHITGHFRPLDLDPNGDCGNIWIRIRIRTRNTTEEYFFFVLKCIFENYFQGLFHIKVRMKKKYDTYFKILYPDCDFSKKSDPDCNYYNHCPQHCIQHVVIDANPKIRGRSRPLDFGPPKRPRRPNYNLTTPLKLKAKSHLRRTD